MSCTLGTPRAAPRSRSGRGARAGTWAARGALSAVLLATIIGGYAMVSSVKPPSREVPATADALPAPQGAAPTYSSAERRALLALARRALTAAVTDAPAPAVPEGLPAASRAPRGCFVTLEKQRALRGCIGHIFPKESLAQAVIDNARSAALHDRRFSPVTPDELPDLEIEISVLTLPEPLSFTDPEELLQKLRPHVDGVVLEIGARRSTFLPQVWEKLPVPTEFLDHLAAKAGSAPDAWRGTGVTVHTYQVEAFGEAELDPERGARP